MFNKKKLEKLQKVTLEQIVEEEKILEGYKPFTVTEKKTLQLVKEKVGEILTPQEVRDILELGKNTPYSYEDLCPLRFFKEDSNRKFFRYTSVLIIAREQNKTLKLSQVRKLVRRGKEKKIGEKIKKMQ